MRFSVLFLLPACAVFGWSTARAAAAVRFEPAFPGLQFEQPLGIVGVPGSKSQLIIVEKVGRLQWVEGVGSGKFSQRTVLDLSQPRDGKFEQGGECGLLGAALHPRWKENAQVFVYYSLKIKSKTGDQLHQRVSRFTIASLSPFKVDPATEQPLISQPDPAGNHNGGDLHFGPDGYLYVSCGDGGAAYDKFNNAGFVDKGFHAAVYRIDVDKKGTSLPPNPHPSVITDSRGEAFYAVPADNPFLAAKSHRGRALDPKAIRTETWATGLRNPWRFSFDPLTSACFTGDVGQNLFEEVDILQSGGDYGWSTTEGVHQFSKADPSGKKETPRLAAPSAFIQPIFEYDRKVGNSVTGGVVYRGEKIPDLKGAYVFGDFGRGSIIALREKAGRWVPEDLGREAAPAGFGYDPDNGDVLVACLTGQVKRILPR